MRHDITRARIKKIARKADMRMEEISTLCGVTRQTLYNWEPPKGPTNGLIARRAEDMLTALENAIAKGFLPLTDVVDKPRRMAKIKQQLSKSFRE